MIRVVLGGLCAGPVGLSAAHGDGQGWLDKDYAYG